MSVGIDLINVMRENASTTYQERIPEATQTNLSQIADLLLSADFKDTYNEFIGIIEKIALTLFVERSYTNKLKRLKKGRLPLGATIEELAIEPAKGTTFDAEGKNNMARVLPHTIAYYHNHIFKHTYSVSVSRYQIRTAFTTPSNLDRFITNTINSLYKGYEQDEFLMTKEVIGNEIPNAYQIETPKPIDNDTGKDFMYNLRSIVMGLEFLSTKYSPIGFPINSPSEKLVLLINYDVLAKISVEVLASAFNKSDTDYTTKIIAVDNFGDFNNSLKDMGKDYSAYAMLVDEDACLFYDIDTFMERDHNGKGAFDTMHLQYSGNYAFSHIYNLVAFVENKMIELTTPSDYIATATNEVVTNHSKNASYVTDLTDCTLHFYKDGNEVVSGTASVVYTFKDGKTESVSLTGSASGFTLKNPTTASKTSADVVSISLTSIA